MIKNNGTVNGERLNQRDEGNNPGRVEAKQVKYGNYDFISSKNTGFLSSGNQKRVTPKSFKHECKNTRRISNEEYFGKLSQLLEANF